jgi:hypothetical protein
MPDTLPAPAIPAAPAIVAPAAPAGISAAPLAVNFSGFYDAAIHDADDSDIAAARLAGISDLDLVGKWEFLRQFFCLGP